MPRKKSGAKRTSRTAISTIKPSTIPLRRRTSITGWLPSQSILRMKTGRGTAVRRSSTSTRRTAASVKLSGLYSSTGRNIMLYDRVYPGITGGGGSWDYNYRYTQPRRAPTTPPCRGRIFLADSMSIGALRMPSRALTTRTILR